MSPTNSPKGFELSTKALGTETVTIYVGSKRKKFLVHKKLICDRSDYFSKAFTGGFQEAEKGVMYLPEDHSETFDSFIDFIYRGTLPKFVIDENPPPDHAVSAFTIEKLAPLFYLAEKYCMNELTNKVMDAIQDHELKYEVMPGEDLMREIYNNTRDKSKLRLYATLLALYSTMTDTPGEDWSKDTPNYTKIATALPRFAADYIMLLRKHRALLPYGYPSDPQIRNDTEGFGKCYFHTHWKREICHLDEGD